MEQLQHLLAQVPLPTVAQPASQKLYIDSLVYQNDYNAWCIDCRESRTTHFNVTYGTFTCEDCATQHFYHFDRTQSLCKPITEVWDSH